MVPEKKEAPKQTPKPNKSELVIQKLELISSLTDPRSKRNQTAQDIIALAFKHANEALDILK